MTDSSSSEFFTLDSFPITFIGVFANETLRDKPVALRQSGMPLLSSGLERDKVVKGRLQLSERPILFLAEMFFADLHKQTSIPVLGVGQLRLDRKSTRLNSSHLS